LKVIDIIVRQEVDEDWSNLSLQHHAIHFSGVLVAQCRDAAAIQLVNIKNYRPEEFTTSLNPMTLNLKSGETHVVEVLGLPSTTAVRVKMAKMELADEEDRKARDMLTKEKRSRERKRNGGA
jgi:hypothetical protein